MTETRNIAVILAGGVGTRIGLDTPKQLVKIAGRPIMEHTLAIFNDHPQIDEIFVLMARGHLDRVHEIVRKNDFDKVTAVLEGSGTRNDTTQTALRAIAEKYSDDCNVILHDAVRPLLAPTIINDVVDALDTNAAVDVAIPSADTIIEVEEGDGQYPVIKDVPPRSNLRRGQTPQAFKLSAIQRAYDFAARDENFVATDDCSVVLRYTPEVPIAVVNGDDSNMKVTQPIDIYIADKLFQLPGRNEHETTEAALREALEGKTVAVFGGSYGIGADIASLASEHGATVKKFSRSTTKTHINRREDLIAARDEILAETGRIDYVVNTAGVLPLARLDETSDETIYEATEINYIGPILLAQTFFPELAKTQGSLLLFTSSSYTRGRGSYSLYSSAKAATVNLTQALADEWSGDGVRINCVNPERTGTPMRTKAFGEEDPGSLLESATVARASLEVLVSNKTGHVIDVRRDDPLSEYSES
ncbi:MULTISPECIES: bifunctional cytidylyltransferase/SDR family oxidoreductase [unclassified Brevibacterium]|uniref:bifunctional cytidylyltransferase/SDR family oxidoreductase n=1 Tax=unclassified Brevibacterium TaxID=2614124 RepID=UPI001E5B6BDA|nr:MULTISPECIES: bifunctional cytidylyltransferase/SDR family oxidoreductase [unclassified Brevibacterium]MCD1285536.1 2-C-methyl-D-erythritol 4-phosphate cytidylyltransferase [Brevibacterium sp. CCUG 69071]MDK8434590.1 bifunctional cytidylyltransferase/SDR family oxidoreductase [Brevibacterium sp. H-BE7]